MKSIRRNVLASEDCFATTALGIFLSDFGTEGLEWLPETIYTSMEGIYGNLPTTTLNKLMAGIQILTTDEYFRKLNRFIDYTNFLNHGNFDDYVADIGEIAWGLTEAKIIDDPGKVSDPLQIFSSSVLQYIEFTFLNSGLVFPPKIFSLYGIDLSNKSLSVLSSYSDNPELYNVMAHAANLHTELVDSWLFKKLEMLSLQMVQVGLPAPSLNW